MIKVENDEIVIRLSVDVLVQRFEDELIGINYSNFNKTCLVEDFINHLYEEDYRGKAILFDAFDEALKALIEHGTDCVEFE